MKLKILIIDDNPGDRLMLKQQLSGGELRDCEIFEADSIKTAIEQAEKNNPDVVLVDLQLPDCVGPVSIQEFRSQFEYIPLIALSGVFDEKVARDVLGYGAQEFFVKGSYNSEILNKAIIYAIERQRVQIQFYEQQKLFNKLTAVARDAICILNENGEVIFWNSAAGEMFGYEQNEIIGNEFVPLFIPDKSVDKYWERWSIFQKIGKEDIVENPIELTAKRKNGELFPIELSLSSVVVSRQWHAIAIIRDITLRKRAQKELEESLENRDKLFSIISHDLRNPFNALLGYSEIIENNSKDFSKEELVQFATNINKTARQLVYLANNLFNWAAVQTGRIKISPTVFNLKDLLIDEISVVTASAELKNITIKSEIQEKAIVFGDPDLLKGVVRNLISNAVKFTPIGGEITVQMKSNRQITELAISDTGVGIPDEKLRALFEFSSDKSTRGTENEKGTGLGLMLCKDFIELMKGEISVESDLNKGTKFKIIIPTIYGEK